LIYCSTKDADQLLLSSSLPVMLHPGEAPSRTRSNTTASSTSQHTSYSLWTRHHQKQNSSTSTYPSSTASVVPGIKDFQPLPSHEDSNYLGAGSRTRGPAPVLDPRFVFPPTTSRPPRAPTVTALAPAFSTSSPHVAPKPLEKSFVASLYVAPFPASISRISSD
jgi:hypothetical protein